MKPIIILIRPQMGENIGAVARAMANFGLSELRIVAPRDGWPNPAAEAMSTNALPIVQAATIYADNASAFADITRAYATTARPREMEKRVLTPEAAVKEMIPAPAGEKFAIVFGPERTGLENEDLSWCDTIVTIPTTEHSSLNIAQSMVLLGYEWFRQWAVDSGQWTANALSAAPLSHYDALFRQLEMHLDGSDFFKVAEKKPGMMLNIKTALLRGRFTEQEIRTLHGVFRALAEKC